MPEDAEPLIFTGMTSSEKCGHGDVVAFDGHTLHATPRIEVDDGNFLELLPEGARVDLLDCRLWADDEGLSWLAVRTAQNKLGWMLVQPDKFYITLYPIVIAAPPSSLTGIPAGTTVAYVPPSECRPGPVTNEAVATSIGIDLLPVVGDLKGVNEAATGCDMVTGERLGDWRWLGLLGLVGLSEVALLRHGDDAADAARVADNLDGSLRYADEAVIATARNADTAADFVRQVSRLDGAADGGSRARTLDEAQELTDQRVRALATMEQPCSFSAETPVSTSTGFVPISEIRAGDLVWAFNEGRGATGYYTVTATFSHLDPEVLALTIGADVVETTPEHPFYVDSAWVAAGIIEVGDELMSASGVKSAVERIEVSHAPQIMYNLTVAEAHTYFVGDGEWLVHNACSRVLRSNLGTPSWAADGTKWQAHHIIPGEWEGHPLVLLAGDRWKIDDAKNGIALPVAEADGARLGLPAHRGSHPSYSQRVHSALDARTRTATTEDEAVAALNDLTSELRGWIQTQAGQRVR